MIQGSTAAVTVSHCPEQRPVAAAMLGVYSSDETDALLPLIRGWTETRFSASWLLAHWGDKQAPPISPIR
jgi:hypothetical protein